LRAEIKGFEDFSVMEVERLRLEVDHLTRQKGVYDDMVHENEDLRGMIREVNEAISHQIHSHFAELHQV